MKKSAIILCLVFLSVVPALLWGFSDNSVVINYIKPVNASMDDIHVAPLSITVALQNEFTKSGKLKVVERSNAFKTDELQNLSVNAGYSAYDAMLLGLETGTSLIVLGRIRSIGDMVWLQIGLFDAEMEVKIEEVTGYYPNSRKGIIEQAIPEMVKKLVNFETGICVGEKPELKACPAVVQKESIRGNNDNADNHSTAIAVKTGAGYYKWAILGLVTVSAALFIDRFSATPAAESAQTPTTHSEVIAKW